MKKVEKLPNWQQDAHTPDEYHYCEASRGREFIFRVMTDGDPVMAVEKFAKDHDIKYGKIHATFMGGFQPTKYTVWVPDIKDPDNWHTEKVATNTNLTMVSSIGGIIHQRPDSKGNLEPCCAMHFVSGGGWDCSTICGHLCVGTRVKGCFQVFITELLDIEALLPVDIYGVNGLYPENFYKNTMGKDGE